MPKTKKEVKVEVHDQTPIKDPRGGGHHGKKENQSPGCKIRNACPLRPLTNTSAQWQNAWCGCPVLFAYRFLLASITMFTVTS
jgi:hypothetical protein